METKTCEVCGRDLPLSAFSKSYKGRCKECVAKQAREKRSGIVATDKPTQIDWEQRRYEIAKALYCQYPYGEFTARDAVKNADALIEELKKTSKCTS